MYARALRSALAGMRAFIAMPSPGFVPHVIMGAMRAASNVYSLSKAASGSLASVRQRSTAASQSAPLGASGRPLRYSKVVSSGATMPPLAPHSIAMLHTVMRPSILSARIASPANSMKYPVPPEVEMREIR